MSLLGDNKVLHLTIILLRSIAADEPCRYIVMKKKINETWEVWEVSGVRLHNFTFLVELKNRDRCPYFKKCNIL